MTTADIAETTTCLRIRSSTTTDVLHLRGGECLYSLMNGVYELRYQCQFLWKSFKGSLAD